MEFNIEPSKSILYNYPLTVTILPTPLSQLNSLHRATAHRAQCVLPLVPLIKINRCVLGRHLFEQNFAPLSFVVFIGQAFKSVLCRLLHYCVLLFHFFIGYELFQQVVICYETISTQFLEAR
jgi:hypothetical protein